jgi:hypothetical protein
MSGNRDEVHKYLDTAICPIPYMQLAKQETEPFLFLGHVVDVNFPRYDDYKRALRRFPDVRSCLIEVERDKPQPDLRQIDWDAVRNTKDIDVCVFRIASSIRDVEYIRLWLTHHNFEVAGLARRLSKKYVPSYETDPIYFLSANLSTEKFREIFPKPWIEKLMGFEGLHSYSLSIVFSQTRQVVGVTSIGNSKLN